MSTQEILMQLLLGGLMGTIGQGLRILVGMKKLNDDAQDQKTKVKDLFDTSRMMVSLLIGFCAGVLAMISISTFKPDFFSSNTKENLLSLVGAGYAGTDFIEGFIKKYLPKSNSN